MILIIKVVYISVVRYKVEFTSSALSSNKCPFQRTTDGIEARPIGKRVAQSKVNKHDFSGGGDEDIGGFDVAVDDKA